MLRASRITASAGTFDYRNGKVERVKLDVGAVVTTLNFKATVTIDTPGAVPVGLTYAGLMGVIDQMIIRINGVDNFIEISGAVLKRLMATDYGHDMIRAVPEIIAGVKEYKFHFKLALYLPRSRTPDVTALDLRAVDDAEILIKWAGSEGVYQEPNTAVVTNVVLDVFTDGMSGVADGQTFMLRSIIQNSIPIVAPHQAFSEVVVKNNQNAFLNKVTIIGMADGALRQIAAGHVRVKQGPFVRIESDGSDMSYGEAFEARTEYEPKIIPIDFSQLGNTPLILKLDELSHDLKFEFPIGIEAPLPAAPVKSQIIVVKEILRFPELN